MWIVGIVAVSLLLLPWWAANKSKQQLHSPLASLSPSSAPSPTGISGFTNDALYLLINAYRLENKLSPLHINPELEQSAQYKLQDMVTNKYYRHTDRADTLPWPFFLQANYQYQRAGENLSFAINTPWQVQEAWMQSPSHNRQLLEKEYQDMGLAHDCKTFKEYPDGGCIVVLHLGRE